MKVLVLGAGVAGVAAAYYLWRDGHEVVVADRQPAAARETSFGNAGGLCPSFAGPWAAPGMIGKVLKMSLQRNSAIRFSLSPEPRKLAWLARWMGQCNAERFRVNKLRMQRVALQLCLPEGDRRRGTAHRFRLPSGWHAATVPRRGRPEGGSRHHPRAG